MSPAPMTALVPASSEVNAERCEEVLSLLLYLITWHIEWCFHPQPFPWHFILLLQSIAMWPLPRQLSRSLACGTNLFLSSGLFSFLSSHLHSLCWPENKGQCVDLRIVKDLSLLRCEGISSRERWLYHEQWLWAPFFVWCRSNYSTVHSACHQSFLFNKPG